MVLRRVARPPPRPPGFHSTALGTGDAGAIPGGLLGAPDSLLVETIGTLSMNRESNHHSPRSRESQQSLEGVPWHLRSPFEQLSTNKIESPRRFIAPKGLQKNVRSNGVWYSTDESWILLFAHDLKSIYNCYNFQPHPDPTL